MMVVVESRRLLYWVCKPLDQLERTCPQKIASINNKTTGITTSITTSTTISATLEPGVHPDNQEKVWILVTRKKDTIIPSYDVSIIRSSDSSNNNINNYSRHIPGNNSNCSRNNKIAKKPQPINLYHCPAKNQKEKEEKTIDGEKPEEVETSLNLKRKREGAKTQAPFFPTASNP